MARVRKEQAEIADPDDGRPIGASPDRDPELHALGLELIDLEERSKAAKAAEKAKREECGAALRRRGLKEYGPIDDVSLWIEGQEKVKAKKEGGRPRGKVLKVVEGEEGF